MQAFKLSHEIPPIFVRLHEAFGVDWPNIIIAYGDTIYCKDKLPQHCIEHELVHLKQQSEQFHPSIWWELYITNPELRRMWEIEAHKAQNAYIRADKSLTIRQRDELLRWIARMFSSPMYGSIITFKEAMSL